MTKAITNPPWPPMARPASRMSADSRPSSAAVFSPFRWCTAAPFSSGSTYVLRRRFRWLGHASHPAAELRSLLQKGDRVRSGVLVLRRPEQRVERADLDADAAVHAQREVDREPVENRLHPRSSVRCLGRM